MVGALGALQVGAAILFFRVGRAMSRRQAATLLVAEA
jgi:hypothetical protein